ncbi:NAD(P)H-quinone oxidoreductase, subunit N [Corchorus olitorius]|uniref:NAD(P)H-quinone oxidoreductase, subunit N n=1 Tax=Corchorus olitorius TaxID=93759 RepID=A0A1R3K5D7_9ROSI|nr:NAD(P)H-quinone oxidoreductase, subunit N [Corchorus olitorius]
MATAAFCSQLQPVRVNWQRKSSSSILREMSLGFRATGGHSKNKRSGLMVKCTSSEGGVGIGDFIGGDLLKFDLGRWLSDVEEHKALAIYTPHEGGYEGRYLTRLRYQGYYFLDLTARGLGDPETTLTKIHPVCPQPIARWYFPPEVDFRLQALPPDAKGLVVWIIEAKVYHIISLSIYIYAQNDFPSSPSKPTVLTP